MTSLSANRALRDAYLEVFLMVGHLQDHPLPAVQAAAMRKRLEQLIQWERQNLLAVGVPEACVDQVQLAVIGLIDESARHAASLGEAWASFQFTLYGQENLGVRFFDALRALRANPDAPIGALEVYARCLALGFQGTYAPDRLEDLEIIRESLHNDLLHRREPPTPLAPHVPFDTVLEAPAPPLRPLWLGVIAATLLVLLGSGLTVQLTTAAHRAQQTLEMLRNAAVAAQAQHGIEGGQ